MKMRNKYSKKMALALLLSAGAYAGSVSENPVTGEKAINIVSLCSGKSKVCEIKGIGFHMGCSGKLEKGTGGMYCSNGVMTFSSLLPITSITGNGIDSIEISSTSPSKGILIPSGRQTSAAKYSVDHASNVEVSRITSWSPEISEVTLLGGVGDLVQSMSGATFVLESAYSNVFRQLQIFKGNISKSDMGHTLRLEAALKEGIELLKKKDKNGKLTTSVLDWRVQENSRIIVAFGSIMDELLEDYDHVTSIQHSIKTMRELVVQLRELYGWNRSIAGKVSKASSTLLDVVRLELQELGAIKMSLGDSVTTYTKLLKITGSLKAKVDASKSGDMKHKEKSLISLTHGMSQHGKQNLIN
ncbi:hypothetical protein [Bacteriovorax sp. Seq25_V]|uniref:hypothetical protein n=1 Tax=Bacteriovorax sp. Seq25_V TaxID=1201288 RepID=UPI00038A36F5|nr:hypothetical protein [Bacteriovorax sp. Seq25_V]EQC45515.1 hypothetical protein M900_2167 [Bacteriovorax sp. Seq25_V]